MYGLGSRMKEIRQLRGLSQRELAKRICKSVSAISSYESDTQMPPLDVLVSIASALNVTLDFLAGFDSHKSYSAIGLSPEQVSFLDSLFSEFNTPTSSGKNLSPEQTNLIATLIHLFSS